MPLPPFDPLGLPAPPGLILALAYLTFTLHLLAVNFTLACVLLNLWVRRKPDAAHADIGRFLGTAAPLGFSYLVTFGIPPLLLAQLVYGQFFYSSSVLVGAFWIAVIPLLIVAYSALHLHRMTRDGHPRLQSPLLWVALLGMLVVGFVYVNNLTLAMTPGRWLQLYAAHPSGATLNLAEPTLWPRWLTFLGLSPAVGGVVLLMRGGWLRSRGRAEAKLTSELGRRAVLTGAAVWLVGLLAWLGTLPSAVRRLALGGAAGMALTAATAVLLATGCLLAGPACRATGLRLAAACAASLGLAFGCVVIVRDQVRMAYLQDHFSLGSVPIYPQWGMFAIFAATLVVGLVFTVVLTARVARRALAGGLPS